MRLLLFAALLLASASAGSAQQPDTRSKADSKTKTDTELIQGTWLIVGLEAGGKAEPERNYRGNTFTFTKDKATLREGVYQPIEFTLSINPDKSPKTFELTTKGNTLKGIYILDGDEMTLCLSIGGPQPTGFTTKPGGDTETFLLKKSQWERYTDKMVGFTVDWPGKPVEQTLNVDSPDGSLTTTIVSVRGETERVTYLVSVTNLPGKLEEKESEAAQELVRKAVIAEAAGKAKITNKADGVFKANGYAGREWTLGLQVPDSTDTPALRVRVFVAGGRMYTLLAVGMEEGTKSPSVTRFWNSFKLPEKK